MITCSSTYAIQHVAIVTYSTTYTIQYVVTVTYSDTYTIQHVVMVTYPFSISRDHLNETQASLADVKDEIQKLTDKTLPSILQELAELQATKILKGDYDLKIARQDYFTSKQDQVLYTIYCTIYYTDILLIIGY